MSTFISKKYDWSAGEVQTCHYTLLKSSRNIVDQNVLQDEKKDVYLTTSQSNIVDNNTLIFFSIRTHISIYISGLNRPSSPTVKQNHNIPDFSQDVLVLPWLRNHHQQRVDCGYVISYNRKLQLLSLFYDLDSKLTGVSSGSGTAYHSGATELTTGCSGVQIE